MRDTEPLSPSLRGSLLVAHPGLLDPNFSQSVILLSAHSRAEGALGVILNRPTKGTLGDLKSEFETSVISDVPVHLGGPVSPDEVLLAAWKWDMEGGNFKLYFGISAEALEELVKVNEGLVTRAFLGYSGWGGGQLEDELQEHAWVVAPLAREYLEGGSVGSWRSILRSEQPELSPLTDTPDDVSLN